MRRFFLFILTAVLFAVPASAAELHPSDRDYLIRAVASSYPDVGFGGRVGICSVILSRMDDDRFPDTAASVIANFGDGCFADQGVLSNAPDEKTLRLTSDALDMALTGADPTGGALYFTILDDGSPVYDLKFDNSGEKMRARTVDEFSRNNALTDAAVVDGVGFWQ